MPEYDASTRKVASRIQVHLFIPTVQRYRAPLYHRVALDAEVDFAVHVHRPSGTKSDRVHDATFGHAFGLHVLPAMRRLPVVGLLWQPKATLPEAVRRGDVVVLCGNPRYLGNYRLLWQARRRGAAVVWWGIGFMPNQRRLAFEVRKRILNLADIVLLYSDEEVRRFARTGFPRARLFATNNCVDQAAIQSARKSWSSDQLADFRRRRSLEGVRLLLYCGRLHRKPRLELALAALLELRKGGGDYRLAIIGAGPQEASLKATAVALGVSDYVWWLGALYDEEQLAPWFLSSLCLVYPGAIGLTLHHALGYGLPVVTTDNFAQQSAEIYALEPEVNGLLYRDGDVSDLARCVRRLSDDSRLRIRLSENAIDTVLNRYTIEQMTDRFLLAVKTASRRKLELTGAE
jgi:glycosyltransferase involved in cell wall biosynthesis